MTSRLRKLSTRAGRIAVVAGIGSIVLPYVLGAHGHHAFEAVPGFWAMFGGLGCGLLVVVSKWLGATVIQKPEDFYDR